MKNVKTRQKALSLVRVLRDSQIYFVIFIENIFANLSIFINTEKYAEKIYSLKTNDMQARV